MPKTETKRKMGKGDVAIYQQGSAKKGGKLDKAMTSLNVHKNFNVGNPLPARKSPDKPQLGEEGRGIIYTLKNRTAIEENKMERKSKGK